MYNLATQPFMDFTMGDNESPTGYSTADPCWRQMVVVKCRMFAKTNTTMARFTVNVNYHAASMLELTIIMSYTNVL